MMKCSGAALAAMGDSGAPAPPPAFSEAGEASETGEADGLRLLCHAMLRQMGVLGRLSRECCHQVERLLLDESRSLHSLAPLAMLEGASAPYATWWAEATTIGLAVLDLSGDPVQASIVLPQSLLARWPPEAIVRVSQELPSHCARQVSSRVERIERSVDESSFNIDEAGDLYSIRELAHGALVVKPPMRGLLSLRLCKMDESNACRPSCVRSQTLRHRHILSSLRRLACGVAPPDDVRCNDACAVLCDCLRDASKSGVARFRQLCVDLCPTITESDPELHPTEGVFDELAPLLCTAIHKAAVILGARRDRCHASSAKEVIRLLESNVHQRASLFLIRACEMLGELTLSTDDGPELSRLFLALDSHPSKSSRISCAIDSGLVVPSASRDSGSTDEATGETSRDVVRASSPALTEAANSDAMNTVHNFCLRKNDADTPPTLDAAAVAPIKPMATCNPHACDPFGAQNDSRGLTTNDDVRRLCAQVVRGLCGQDTSVAFVAPELAGWGAVGGLGVMVGQLASALARRGVAVTVVVPAYASCSSTLRNATHLCELVVPMGTGGAIQYESLSVHDAFIPTIDGCAASIAGSCTSRPSSVDATHVSTKANQTCDATQSSAAKGSCEYSSVSPSLVHEGICGSEARVRVLLLRSDRHFRAPYMPAGARGQLLSAALLARGSVLLLEHLGIKPDVLVSNDWVAGLVAPCVRCAEWRVPPGEGLLHSPEREARVALEAQQARGHWGRCALLHLIHNLETGYDGCLSSDSNGCARWRLDEIHGLPPQLLAHRPSDAGCVDNLLSLSRAALLSADSWATVSASYRAQLLTGEGPYSPLLRSFPAPFACALGIPLVERRDELVARGMFGPAGHCAAKMELRRQCFGNDWQDSLRRSWPAARLHSPQSPEDDLDETVPIIAFVGRLTHQKGVHLLLECVEPLLSATGGRVQILVCGCAEASSAYAQRCARQMAELCQRHPANFWCSDPRVFFEEGLFVTAAADFGVMPSLFEPSGLVGEEFLCAGTPLVCADTGGMRDRVRRAVLEGGAANGLLFAPNDHQALLTALLAAVSLFNDAATYKAMRDQASASACDVEHTAFHWHAELVRLHARRVHSHRLATKHAG